MRLGTVQLEIAPSCRAAALVAIAVTLGFARTAAAATGEPIEFFEREIRPLLATHCYQCHSAGSKPLRGSLRLDSRAAMLRGGDSGEALRPGKPDDSLIIEAVRYESYEMPPKGKLADEEIARLARWVEMGAPWPDEAEPVAAFDLAARKAAHWAWRPIGDPPPRDVKQKAWPANAIDHFVLARLEAEGLAPVERADRHALARRLYFDLIGLPPTREEVRAFVEDTSRGALPRLVDRLLASPRFGERWGRHWLDLVRYAESRGHEGDDDTLAAFQYRDYVIRALNEDVPYDDLIREHVAGDLLDRPRLNAERGFNESILGTGFWFLGEWVHSPVDIRKDETDRFDNMIDVMSKTFLGLTISCARCHDHKFDAISTRDYYALTGFLQSCDYRQVRFETLERERDVARRLSALDLRHRPLAVAAIADGVERRLPRSRPYIAAAAEVLLADGVVSDEQVESLASERALRAARLQEWVTALGKLPPAKPASAARVHPVSAIRAVDDARVVVDYATLEASEYRQDGFAFGASAARPGELWLDPALDGFRPRVARQAAARFDPIWSGLVSDAGLRTNRGAAIDALPRSGRTLRTPTFEVVDGAVACLVIGEGHVVACVDSHRLVRGPLHEETLVKIAPAEDIDQPRWVTMNLARYVGHRLHLEFTPGDTNQLQVLRVVDGARPDDDAPRAAREGGVVSAVHIEDRLTAAIAAWKESEAGKGRLEEDEAATLDWLMLHLSLIGEAGDTAADAAGGALEAWWSERRAIGRDIPKESATAMAMWDGSGEEGQVLIRGDAATPGETATRRFLEAIDGAAPLAIATGSGRLELAERIVDPANPLTARVIVNRLWHHLLGRGIVPTVDDFGVLGQPPSHPELLDHLASWFLANGQSIKATIRYIVLSETYQLSSRASEVARARDPKNLLWASATPRRLEGEAIRDAMLALSGELDVTMYGEPVPIHLTPFMDGRGRPDKSGPLDGACRRSIYIAVRRNFLSPFQLAFDAPVPFSTMGRRNVSNVPAQALILMNDPFVLARAARFAEVARSRSADDAARVAWMYESSFARSAGDEELRLALDFVRSRCGGEADDDDHSAAWADLAHALWNTKEFIFLP